MRVLCCGGREWTDFETIYECLSIFPPGTVVIHGDCKGADRLSGKAAFLLGFEVEEYPANWKEHGKLAGPIRNREMFAKSHPDFYLAFHTNLPASKGTKDMVNVLETNKIPGTVVRYARPQPNTSVLCM